jgi:hypothetical protein
MSLNCGHHWHIVHSQMIYDYGDLRWNDTDREKPMDSEKNCTSVTLSTTDPIRNDSSTNPGLRCKKPATNCLDHKTVSLGYYFQLNLILLHKCGCLVHLSQ